MADRALENAESVCRFLGAELPHTTIGIRPVGVLGIVCTRFTISESHKPPRCLCISVELMEDAESGDLLERLRTDRVAERLREGESLRVTAENTDEIDPWQ